MSSGMPPKKGKAANKKNGANGGAATKRKREGDARTYYLTQLTQLAQLAQPTRSIVVRWHFFCIACIELFA